MNTKLNDFEGKYTKKDIMDNISTNNTPNNKKEQWVVYDVCVGVIPKHNKQIKEYALFKIQEVLNNSEDTLKGLLSLKSDWRNGAIEKQMEKDIKTGKYQSYHNFKYVSRKKFTGIIDDLNPDYNFPISLEQDKLIVYFMSLGASVSKIYEAMGFDMSFEKFNEFISLNKSGAFDIAFNYVIKASQSKDGFIDYVRDVPSQKDLDMSLLKITADIDKLATKGDDYL